MTLSNEDSRLFFKLWMPLLRFGSDAYDLHVGHLLNPRGEFNFAAGLDVAEEIWSDVSILDDYLARRPELTDEERSIVLDWKRVVHGRFAIERHLRGGSIFIALEDNRVFLVKGLTDPFQVMLDGLPMPILATASLLPFKGSIITDGLLDVSRVTFGRNIAGELKDIYMAAKREGRIEKGL